MKIKILVDDDVNKLYKNEVYEVLPFWLDENETMLSLLILNESKEDTK